VGIFRTNLASLYGTIKGKSITRVDGVEIIKGKKYNKHVTVILGIPRAEAEINYYRKSENSRYFISGKSLDRKE